MGSLSTYTTRDSGAIDWATSWVLPAVGRPPSRKSQPRAEWGDGGVDPGPGRLCGIAVAHASLSVRWIKPDFSTGQQQARILPVMDATLGSSGGRGAAARRPRRPRAGLARRPTGPPGQGPGRVNQRPLVTRRSTYSTGPYRWVRSQTALSRSRTA